MVAANSTERGGRGNLQQSPGMGIKVAGTPAPAPPTATPGTGNAALSSDDLSKKIRKPYTITKSRESWTEQEHDKFLEALQLFDRDWKKIEAFVGSKTVIQIRSHAQKYFLKVQKNGLCEHVPPPRPKRKAAHPYPQKASKNVTSASQATVPYQAPPYLAESGYPTRTESSTGRRNSTTGATEVSCNQNSIPPPNASHAGKDDTGVAGVTAVNNSCSGTESPPRAWPASKTTDPANHVPNHHVMPDFVRVYSFIGSLFDPNESGQLQKLRGMDPIDVETVVLLMKNLSINLMSPDFEDHKQLFSSYDVGSEETKSVSAGDSFHSNEAIDT